MSDKVRDYLEVGKRLEEAATPGPWDRRGDILPCLCDADDTMCVPFDCGLEEPFDIGTPEFIADARTRLPRYRRAIEAARREVDAITHEIYDGVANAAAYRILDAMKRALLGEEKA